MEIQVDPFIIVLPEFSIVRLREREGKNRALDISANAVTLYYLLTIAKGVETDRPIIHKTFIDSLRMLGVNIEKIIIDDLINNTFHSHIYIKNPNQAIYSIDAHVTDAVGLSILQDCPLFVTEEVFEKKANADMAKKTTMSDEEALRMIQSLDTNKFSQN